ncbi:PREDICTED: protein RRNAD1-like [Ceratosolen solmsi marchali]|uniref:Protein RRNAD1-like n=1 Tax=Ceratosolen solmsi marchali TaxID=326594 RepID=A0AAJ6VL86_9HYME|nr:PREDICTED: protein RRNAD1-like [Ceratosolen solmsi marchali]
MATLNNTCVFCKCRVCSGIRSTVDQIFQTLHIYGWMLDVYVVDFFQDNLWNRLPAVWRNFLEEITSEEIGKWILKESGSKRVWPLSLLALRTFVESAEICRDHRKECILKCSVNNYSNHNDLIKNLVKNKEPELSGIDVQFNNIFKKRIKKKKKYEIDVISQITADCAKITNCECIVDIGAGMCHLSRILAYKYNLNVICVEQNELLLENARKWDEQLVASLIKYIPDFCERKSTYISLQVGISSAERRQLADRLTNIFIKDFNITNEKNGFGLVGLHPCGDLASTLLRLYSTDERARFICIVGCCYMKLSLSERDEKGYPMSQYFAIKEYNNKLSYAALEIACHALEKHCDKLKTNSYEDLKVHAYRAVLEYLLIEKNPNLRHTQLKNTKVKEDTTFKQYCEIATQNLELNNRPTDLDFERTDVKNYLQQWKRVLLFGSLRLLLAPLVETLVLFDRFLYLSESNLSPSLKAQFDARFSPRNLLLISMK